MTDCPFCDRIDKGDYDHVQSGYVSFEPLNPVTPGHRLFVPALHVEHSDLAGTPAVAGAMRVAHDHGLFNSQTPSYNLIISDGEAATQTIAHIHVHYVPRHPGDGLHLPWTGQQE